MSTISTAFNANTDNQCARVVKAIAKVNSNTNAQKPNGILGALKSKENKGTFEIDKDPNKQRPQSGGTFRKVYTKDIKPICNQDTTADAVCALPNFTSGIQENYVYAEHSIDLSIKREINMDLEAFKIYCGNPEAYIADRLDAMRVGVWEEMNKKATARVIAYVGSYAGQTGGDTSLTSGQEKNISFMVPNGAGGFIFDPTGYANIKDEYAKLGYEFGAPIIVGGSQLSTFATTAEFLGGTNFNGVNKTGIPSLFTDYGVDVAFGDGLQHLLTWKAGALQLQDYTEITNDMIKISVKNQRERMRVFSPFGDGLTWDYFWDVDASGCNYVMKWQTWYDVIAPVPYVEDCAPKPILHFLTGCSGNTCANSGSGGSGE